MAFAVANLCSSRVDLNDYNCLDKTTLGIDLLLVAALTTAVCLVVIGEMDLYLGSVGTLSNTWIQLLLITDGGCVAFDVIMIAVKACSSSRTSDEIPVSSKKFSEKTAKAKEVDPPPEDQQTLAISVTAPQLVHTLDRSHPDGSRPGGVSEQLAPTTRQAPRAVAATPSEEALKEQGFYKLNQAGKDLYAKGRKTFAPHAQVPLVRKEGTAWLWSIYLLVSPKTTDPTMDEAESLGRDRWQMSRVKDSKIYPLRYCFDLEVKTIGLAIYIKFPSKIKLEDFTGPQVQTTEENDQGIFPYYRDFFLNVYTVRMQ